MSSEQADAQGEMTHNKDDKHPHRRKVQVAIHRTSSPRKKLLATRTTGKHVTVFERRYPRKNLPLSEKSQVTIGEFVYKRSKAREDSPLCGKWHKYRKGENRILETVSSLPKEEKEG